MTLGEKLQFHRKRLGLSQEQLANKLYLSRQTVSLWEKDQTQPTLDNLIRLREIFGVSTDELLTDEAAPAAEEKPLEHYDLTFTKKDCDDIHSSTSGGAVIMIVLGTVFFVLTLVFFLNTKSIPLLDIMGGAWIMWVVFTILLRVNNLRMRKISDRRMLELRHTLDVYPDGYTTKGFDGETEVSLVHRKFSDLTNIKETDGFFLVQNLNQYQVIPKKQLAEESLLARELRAKIQENAPKPPGRGLQTFSVILCLLSLISFISGVLIATCIFPNSEKSLWVMFVSAVVPLALVVFAVYLRKKKYRHKGQLLIGVVSLMVCLSLGSLSLTPPEKPDYTSYSADRFTELCGDVGLTKLGEVEALSVDNVEFYETEQDSETAYLLAVTQAFYEEKQSNSVEKAFKSDKNSMTEEPKNWNKIAPPYTMPEAPDYVLVYNATEDTYNTPPKGEDTCNYITFVYNSEFGEVMVYEYEVSSE